MLETDQFSYVFSTIEYFLLSIDLSAPPGYSNKSDDSTHVVSILVSVRIHIKIQQIIL